MPQHRLDPAPGSTSSLRTANQQRVLDVLRGGTVGDPTPGARVFTQAELSRATGLAPATVSNIVRELAASGLVETDPGSGRRGSSIRLARGAGLVGGVDFGHSHVAVAVGDLTGVSDNKLQVGDSVIINPGISDYTCEYCQAGEHSLCVKFGILGEHSPGTFAEKAVVPARNLFPIPEKISFEQAAQLPGDEIPRAHVLRFLLAPDEGLRVREGRQDGFQLLLVEPIDRDVTGEYAVGPFLPAGCNGLDAAPHQHRAKHRHIGAGHDHL